MRGSKLLFPTLGKSSLCFTRPLLAQILPMPETLAIALNDLYLQFAAIFLSKGIALAKELALQRVHEGNAYTLKTDNQRLVARINILMAYWLRLVVNGQNTISQNAKNAAQLKKKSMPQLVRCFFPWGTQLLQCLKA